MSDAAPRARRRLRQRSDTTNAQSDYPTREIISIESSSDEFVVGSDGENDASDDEDANQSVRSTAPSKRRGLKRLRRATDADDNDSDDPPPSAEPVPASDEWECTRCTYLNEPQRQACELCFTAKALPRPTRKLSAWLTSSSNTTAKKPKATAKQSDLAPVETIDSSDDSESFVAKKHRKKAVVASNEAGALWSEATNAQQTDELCVQKKKVQEVQEWLQQSVPCQSGLHQNRMKRLVFLCGPPGSGKSTTLRYLAKTMGIAIKEWRDNSSAGKLQYHRHMKDEFRVSQTSAWDDFIDFINRSVNFSALQVAVIPDKRVRKRPLAQTQVSQSSSSTQAQLILIENWPQNPFGSSQDSSMWDEKLMTAFRQVVNPAANLQYPVVCIFSDVRDKKVDANQLAKVFSDEVVRSPFSSIINFNPVTAAQMKKTLSRTLEKLNYSVSTPDLIKIVDRSDGDMRHAMNMAQLMHNRQSVAPKKRSDPKRKKSTLANLKLEDSDSEETSRDPFFSDFHIVGKLLHSKNIKLEASQSSDGTTTESKLVEFDRILDSSAMALDRVLSLLHSNCVDYFTEIDDLGDALSLMSQSESWLHGAYRTTSSSAAFKTSHDIVRSVVVRSIALTNKHPAPSAFRPITAPRSFETTRRMVSNREQTLMEQQAMTGGSCSTHPYLCRGDVYAFEVQPFVDVLRTSRNWSNAPSGMHGAIQSATDHQVADDEIEDSGDDGW